MGKRVGFRVSRSVEIGAAGDEMTSVCGSTGSDVGRRFDEMSSSSITPNKFPP